MSDSHPLTSQEIDDGWRLDEALPPDDDQPYLEYSVTPMSIEEIRASSSGFKRTLRNRNRGMQTKPRVGKSSKRFSRRRKRRARHARSD
jgi:hypothetical protein